MNDTKRFGLLPTPTPAESGLAEELEFISNYQLTETNSEICRAAAARIRELEARLEITHAYRMNRETKKSERFKLSEDEKRTFPDGIECRDATIKLLENRIRELKAETEVTIARLEAENGRLRNDGCTCSVCSEHRIIPAYD